jgi:hypothetical protein
VSSLDYFFDIQFIAGECELTEDFIMQKRCFGLTEDEDESANIGHPSIFVRVDDAHIFSIFVL